MTNPEPDVTTDHRVSLFEGDISSLTPVQRSALVKLVKNHYITAASDTDEWAALIESPRLITSRLHDLYLDLHIDTRNGVAYKKRIPIPDNDNTLSLLRNTRWSAHATVLLIVLRERLRAERTVITDDVYVDAEELVDAMRNFLPKTTDESQPQKITHRAIVAVSDARILQQVGTSGRYKISPVLESLLPLPKLQQLHEWLIGENGGQTQDDPS
ncbi:DUF4194 domain-containing protein [Rhodococcus sp. USK13]|uniref:DUF4194 domain-containing protein n=1 Tax=Rhodococcus sp. USK13 TaxID=2806442 RepID=UPI001BD1AE22|nr:DUF4194 domain-containing protein [Rhodococcus sp. USK13]